MPARAPRRCHANGCRKLIREPREWLCHQCEKQRQRTTNTQRTKTNNYNGAWVGISKAYLRTYPLCEECLRHGYETKSTQTDHITPLNDGGTNEWSNLKALCRACHSRKTATYDQGFGNKKKPSHTTS